MRAGIEREEEQDRADLVEKKRKQQENVLELERQMALRKQLELEDASTAAVDSNSLKPS